tara:strand:- start:124 stop:837 length:714 start_codon:yes stop_codon:yes gene_type:complete
MNTKERINEVFKRFNTGLTATDEVVAVETKLESQAVLENGTEIYTDAESFEDGADVYIINDEGERIPLPEGEYILDDGTVLSIAEGGKVKDSEAKAEDKGEGDKENKPSNPSKTKGPDAVAPTPPAKKKPPVKKSADEKLADDAPMTYDEVRNLINEVIDERMKGDDEEVVEEEMTEVEQLKETLAKQLKEITELKTQEASQGVRRAVPTKAKTVQVDLKNLNTEERIKALFNQFNS